MTTVEAGRALRFRACRVVYRGCSLLSASDFETALREQLPGGSVFFCRRFVRSSGEVSYDVVVDFSNRVRGGSIEGIFGLLGDSGTVELLKRPAHGEYRAAFVTREVSELRTAGDGLKEEFFGNMGVTGVECHGREMVIAGGQQGQDAGAEGTVKRVFDEVMGVARDSFRGLPCSMKVVDRAVEMQQERVKLAELSFVQAVVQDDEMCMQIDSECTKEDEDEECREDCVD